MVTSIGREGNIAAAYKQEKQERGRLT